MSSTSQNVTVCPAIAAPEVVVDDITIEYGQTITASLNSTTTGVTYDWTFQGFDISSYTGTTPPALTVEELEHGLRARQGYFIGVSAIDNSSGCTAETFLDLQLQVDRLDSATYAAQLIGDPETPLFNPQDTLPLIKFYDDDGNRYTYEELIIPGNTEIAGIFRLHFEEEDRTTGTGFDDPTLGQARRDAVVAAFEDLSFMLTANGDPGSLPMPYTGVATDALAWVNSPGNPLRVDIQILGSGTGAGQTPVDNDVLGFASSFFAESGPGGLRDGSVMKLIKSGVDPHFFPPATLTTNADPTVTIPQKTYHGRVAFNFNPPVPATATTPAIPAIDWYLNVDNSVNIGTGQFDMYTVALHEAPHMLGFASNYFEEGYRQAAPNSFDRYLTGNSGQTLPANSLDDATNCFAINFMNQAEDDLVKSGCNQLVFNGPNTNNQFTGGQQQTIFTAQGWVDGSSMSHVNCDNPTGWVMNRSPPPGRVQRSLNPVEAAILCDLGYDVQPQYGSIANLNKPNGRYVAYPAGVCNAALAAVPYGTNDFDDDGSTFTGVPYQFDANFSTLRIPLPDFTDNDGVAGTANLTTPCFEAVGDAFIASNITLSVDNTTPIDELVISIPAAINGFLGINPDFIIRYRPRAGSLSGNNTYIFVRAINTPDIPRARDITTTCNTAPQPCRFICNGDLEDGLTNAQLTSTSQVDFNLRHIRPDRVNRWGSINSPDYFATGANTPQPGTPNRDVRIPINTWSPTVGTNLRNTPNDNYIGIASINNGYAEQAYTRLTTPLTTGRTYRLRYWVHLAERRTNRDNNPADPTRARASFSTGAPILGQNRNFPVVSDQAFLSPLISRTGNNNWTEVVQEFTAAQPYDYLTLGLEFVNGRSSYMYFDDISLVEVPAELTITKALSPTTPGPFCPGDQVIFDIEVTNTSGTATYQNLDLLDLPDENLIFNDAESEFFTLDNNEIVLDDDFDDFGLGFTSPGNVQTFPIVFNVAAAPTDNTFSNEVRLLNTGFCDEEVTAQTEADINCDVSIVKEVANRVGNLITYRLTVSNFSGADLNNLVVWDQPTPPGSHYFQGGQVPNPDGFLPHPTLPETYVSESFSLQDGESRSFTISFMLDDRIDGTLENCASVRTIGSDEVRDEDCIIVPDDVPTCPQMAVTSFSGSPVFYMGTIASYTIFINNPTNTPITGATLNIENSAPGNDIPTFEIMSISVDNSGVPLPTFVQSTKVVSGINVPAGPPLASDCEYSIHSCISS